MRPIKLANKVSGKRLEMTEQRHECLAEAITLGDPAEYRCYSRSVDNTGERAEDRLSLRALRLSIGRSLSLCTSVAYDFRVSSVLTAVPQELLHLLIHEHCSKSARNCSK